MGVNKRVKAVFWLFLCEWNYPRIIADNAISDWHSYSEHIEILEKVRYDNIYILLKEGLICERKFV